MDLVTLSTTETPITTSLKIAEVFGKEHRNVLQSIRAAIADLENLNENRLLSFEHPDSKENFSDLFEVSEFTDGNGDKQPAYNLTEEGFALVALGFTGEKAFAFKVAYVKAFKLMKNEIISQHTLKLGMLTDKLDRADRHIALLESQPSESGPEQIKAVKAKADKAVERKGESIRKTYVNHYSKLLGSIGKIVDKLDRKTKYAQPELSDIRRLIAGQYQEIVDLNPQE